MTFCKYIIKEKTLQVERMKALGIDTDNQFFEQAVNAVIFMAENLQIRVDQIQREHETFKSLSFESHDYDQEEIAKLEKAFAQLARDCAKRKVELMNRIEALEKQLKIQ